MNIEDLIKQLKDAKYKTEDGYNLSILGSKEKENTVMNVIYTWALQQSEYNGLLREKAVLEAKCYAYEQILKNSNFAPLVDDQSGAEMLYQEGI